MKSFLPWINVLNTIQKHTGVLLMLKKQFFIHISKLPKIDRHSILTVTLLLLIISCGSNNRQDAIRIASHTQHLTETDAILTTSGDLTTSNPTIHFSPKIMTGAIGHLELFSDGSWHFTANSTFDDLNEGDNVNETFEIISQEGISTSITIIINGTNDEAIVSNAHQTLENNAPLTTTGILNASDIDNPDDRFTPISINETIGELVLSTDGNWRFTANAAMDNIFIGDSFNQTFNVSTEDGTPTTINITIKGTKNRYFDFLFPSQLENAKITFTWLVLIYKAVDISANPARGHPRIQRSLSQKVIDDYVDEIRKFEAFTANYTHGEIGFNMAVVIVDDLFPIKSAIWRNNKYEWLRANDIKRELDLYIEKESGWFDNIHIFYPGMGSWGPSAAYGGGGYFKDNITRSQYHYFTNNKHDWRVGTWHESIHGLEIQYWFDTTRRQCCRRGKASNGNDIALHNQPDFGYRGNQGPNRPESENYFQWMADLTTGNIRNLNTDGWQNYATAPNTSLGFGENGMYSQGPVRNEFPFKSGGPFPQK